MVIQKIKKAVGQIKVPGDKSISHRAVMLGSLSNGVTEISGFLKGADCLSTIDCFRKMGIDIDINGENCWGEEKVKRLYEKFPNAKCEEFYSDSLSDTPLAELADKAMIIRGNELIEWNEYKPSKLKMFLSREFLSFLIVGGINTVSNVIFSTIYSLFIPNTTLAFFPGYITSNVVSYLLNSKLTFKERLGFVKFIKFFISYIPNFIIQTIIVWLFDNFIHGPSVIAYAIAAIIGVPVTFVFMKIFTFKKND